MSNSRFYKIVIVLLLLLNGGTLVYLLVNHNKEPQIDHMPPTPKGENRVDRMLKERLALTPEQEQAFRLLKKEHHEQMVAIQQEEKQLHKELFLLLQSEVADNVKRDAYLTKLAENDREKEKVTFEHFAKLRLILSAEQLPKFDELVADMANKILSHHRMGKEGHPPPNRRR